MSIALTPAGRMRPPAAPQDLPPDTADLDEQLLDASRKLEALFVNQLFRAMRKTIPEESLLSGGAGESLFTEMLDATLSEEMARRLDRGIASAIYRQLRPLLGATESTEEGT